MPEALAQDDVSGPKPQCGRSDGDVAGDKGNGLRFRKTH